MTNLVSLEFPVGLIIINVKSKNALTFEISEINLFAVELLQLDNNNIYNVDVFKEKTSKFTARGLKNPEGEINVTLFQNIINANEKCHCSNYINDRDQIIYTKIRKTFNKVFIVIDDFDDDRVSVQEKLVSSIPRQYLITISHELNNYFCGLITTLEETQIQLSKNESKNLYSCIDLIKKMIKLFILYSKVSLDRVNYSSEKIHACLEVETILDNALKKYSLIFDYKSIIIKPFNQLKGYFIETNYTYFKNLINVIFLYIYYKVPEGGTVNFSICKITSSKYSLSVSCNCYQVGFESPSFIRKGTINVVEDCQKINENDIKKSVVTIPILEYLLESISKFLNFEIVTGGSQIWSQPTLPDPGEFLSIKMDRIVYGPIGNVSYYNVTNGFNFSTNHSSYKSKNSPNENNESCNICAEDKNSKNSSLIAFSFDRKNTFEKSKTYNHIPRKTISISSLKHVVVSEKDDNNEVTAQRKRGESLKDISFFQSLYNDNGGNSTFSKIRKKVDILNIIKKKEDKKMIHLNESCIFPLSDEDDTDKSDYKISPNKQINYQIGEDQVIKLNKRPSRFNSSSKSVISYLKSDTIILKNSIRNKISWLEETNKINLNDFIEPPDCGCKNIAVVDDENSILNSMINIIKKQNLDCDSFKDGKDCFDKIIKKSKCLCSNKYYKLILMDIYMPEWSGIKTCEKIEELITNGVIPKTLNVVLISAHKEKDINVPNYEFIKGFYQKPVSKNTVINILQQFYS